MLSTACTRFLLEGAAFISANAHPVTTDNFLREIIDAQGEDEEDKANHEERAIMNAAAHYLAHFLRDNSRHGVDRLEKCAQTLREIGNGDAISGAKQHHHRLAKYAAQNERTP